MVDAQGASVANRGPDGCHVMLVAVGTVLVPIRWREPPVLAVGREIVRRRTDTAPTDVILAMSPQFAAIAVGGQGKIVIQPDVDTGGAYFLLRVGCLLIDAPL